MEVHYIGSYRMHPDRSSCLGLSANGLIVWQIHQDSCLEHFAKQEFRMAPPKLHGRVRIGLPELHGRIRMVWPKLHGRFRMVWPKLHGRFHMVWPKFWTLYWDSICSHQNCTVGVFWHTLSIMQEKHWKNLFEIEWLYWLYCLAAQWYTESVLWREEGYTVKYSLSPRDFPEGSGYISPYIPTRVTIQTFSIT